MTKKSFVLAFLMALFALAMVELGRAQERRRLPTNKEIVSSAQSVYVQSDTFYMKRENLESSLLGRAEFKAWDIQITTKPELTALLIRVRRLPFTNPYSYPDNKHATETIVIA